MFIFIFCCFINNVKIISRFLIIFLKRSRSIAAIIQDPTRAVLWVKSQRCPYPCPPFRRISHDVGFLYPCRVGVSQPPHIQPVTMLFQNLLDEERVRVWHHQQFMFVKASFDWCAGIIFYEISRRLLLIDFINFKNFGGPIGIIALRKYRLVFWNSNKIVHLKPRSLANFSIIVTYKSRITCLYWMKTWLS